MLVQCNGMFPRVDKNGAPYVGGVIQMGDKRLFARAALDANTISLQLSEMLPDNGGFNDAGTVTGVHHGGGVFTFEISGHKLGLAVRRIVKKGGRYKPGTVFLGSMQMREPATQADLAAFLDADDLGVEAPAKKTRARRAPAKKK